MVWSLATLAVLIVVPENVGAIEKVTDGIVTLWLGLSLPRLHGKPAAHGAPAETKVSPTGGGSVSIALVAAPVPTFFTVMV